jgi:hypothetical protein
MPKGFGAWRTLEIWASIANGFPTAADVAGRAASRMAPSTTLHICHRQDHVEMAARNVVPKGLDACILV